MLKTACARREVYITFYVLLMRKLSRETCSVVGLCLTRTCLAGRSAQHNVGELLAYIATKHVHLCANMVIVCGVFLMRVARSIGGNIFSGDYANQPHMSGYEYAFKYRWVICEQFVNCA